MANPFDQFDEASSPDVPPPSEEVSRFGFASGKNVNPFDQFDPAPKATPAEIATQKAKRIFSGSLAGKITDAVRGTHDPAYADLKSFDEEMQAENNSGAIRAMRLAAPVAATDEGYGDIMKKSLAERFVRKEKDANGYDIIVYHGPDGAERKAYVNKPGLDTEDVGRGIVSSVPYLVGGIGTSLATKGLPLLGRAAAQFAAGSGTSFGSDIATQALGSKEQPDAGRAAVMGGFGAAGEVAAPVVSAVWRKLVTEPGLYDAAAGQLTQRGVKAVVEAGLDPAAFTKDMSAKFAKAYAKSGDAAMAGRQFATHDLGIESTVGQRTKNPAELLKEGAMWRGNEGEVARQHITDFYALQRAQVRNAALGNPEEAGAGNIPGRLGIGAAMNPAREIKDMVPQELGASIQEGLQTAQRAARGVEDQAWSGLRNITAAPEAIELLPQYIGPVLNAREIDQTVTPMAYKMATTLHRYVTGEAGETAFSALGQTLEKPTVDGMRRRLGQMVGDAAPGSDKSAAGEIYRQFNEWIGAAADRQFLAGHPDAAAALRTAREISREIKDIFQPRDMRTGQALPAKSLIDKVMQKADSPEAVVRAVVGRPDAEIRVGAVDLMNRLKRGLDRFGGAEGQNVWNDIRSAYYMKMITDGKGELMSPQTMLNTIKKTFEKQPTMVNTLYTPAERAEIKKLVKSLEQITYKDPNQSGSGYAIANLLKGFLGMLIDQIPLAQKITVPFRLAYQISGMPAASARAAARAATSQAAERVPPTSLSGPSKAAGNVDQRTDEREDRQP